MRLHLLLPQVNPSKRVEPTKCVYPNCSGTRFRFHQPVSKALRDTRHSTVEAHRYHCLKCGRTFRVYPEGVSSAQTSQRVKGLAVLLYLLGLSYGAVSLALEAIGIALSKTHVYNTVQETAKRVPGLKREQVFEGIKTSALGSDLTSVKCRGKWLPLGITVDAISGLALSIDALPGEDMQTLKEWVEPIAQQVGAQVLVTDDADGFKTVADEIGVQHQVCKSHVLRNTESLIERFKALVGQVADASLQAIGVSAAQAQADLTRLGQLIKSRKREEAKELEVMHHRYGDAVPPRPGEAMSLAYRLRMVYLDRWNLWFRLTRYRSWKGPKGEQIDGTNNACERAIGWWIKERYRSMRGYKVPANAERVSRLLAWSGNFLNRGGADLTLLMS